MNALFVGIAGGTASGKSTTSLALARALGAECLLVFHDRYYRSVPDGNTQAFNFDHPDSLDTETLVADLGRLRAGLPTRMPVYDFSHHTRAPEAEWELVEPRPIVIVEGILVLAEPALRDAFDFKVFVHAPADVRLARRIRRDMAERGRSVESVLDQYERTVRPMHDQFIEPSRHMADLIVDGCSPTESMVAAVRGLIAR